MSQLGVETSMDCFYSSFFTPFPKGEAIRLRGDGPSMVLLLDRRPGLSQIQIKALILLEGSGDGFGLMAATTCSPMS